MTATYVPAPQSAAPTTTTTTAAVPKKGALWTGRVLSGIAVLFLAFDGLGKFFAHPEALKGTQELGWPVEVLGTLGTLQLVCLALYLVPRTAVLGAVLWTGYLGGAIATHVRVENPLFTHVLFPVYVAALLWGGLYLRDARVRALAPWRSGAK